MNNKIFYTVKDVMDICGLGRNKAYDVIRKLNAELSEQGFITVKGKVNRAYFDSKLNPMI